MKRGRVFFLVLVVALLALIGQVGLAQSPEPTQNPTEFQVIASLVSTHFVYQGRLVRNGRPANGQYDFVFKLYNASTGGAQIGHSITKYNVPVKEGLFNVTLDFGPQAFRGEERWLEVWVRRHGTSAYVKLVPRQPIYAVPYALSLRPGAQIVDSVSSAAMNKRVALPPPRNLAWKYGLYGSADGSASNTTYIGVGGIGKDIGVYGSSTSADGYGGKFVNTASGGVALYTRAHSDADADLVLGGTSTSNDNGVLSSDPRYPSSDIVIKTNDTVRIDLDSDKSGEDADFEIRDKDGHLLFDVDESGAVISALPRPAYDSGWQSIPRGGTRVFAHDLGGNVDNYVVDMTCKSHYAHSYGINQISFGGDTRGSKMYGAYWRYLTSTSIIVVRPADDVYCQQVRVRIWVYK